MKDQNQSDALVLFLTVTVVFVHKWVRMFGSQILVRK